MRNAGGERDDNTRQVDHTNNNNSTRAVRLMMGRTDLEVAVDDAVVVEVLCCLEQLLGHHAAVLFCVHAAVDNAVKELAARGAVGEQQEWGERRDGAWR